MRCLVLWQQMSCDIHVTLGKCLVWPHALKGCCLYLVDYEYNWWIMDLFNGILGIFDGIMDIFG